MRIICLEEHILDPAWAAAAAPVMAQLAPQAAHVGTTFQEGPEESPRIEPPRIWPGRMVESPEERIAAMDRAGIDMQVLSYTNQTQALPVERAVDLTRTANDRLADIVVRHPRRFAGFGTLPWGHPEAAVQEAERCARDLGLTAVMLTGRPAADELVDTHRFEPVLAQLGALRMPLYIHPWPPLPAVRRAYYDGFDKDVSARLSLHGWGWHHEAGIQVLRLILSGALDRNPDLTLISGHWGEMVPFFLQRLEDSLPRGVTGLARTLTQTYRDQVYVTPSGMFDLPHFTFIREVLGADRVLFAVDNPLIGMTGARGWLEGLPIAQAEKDAIASGTATRLLRLEGTRPDGLK